MAKSFEGSAFDGVTGFQELVPLAIRTLMELATDPTRAGYEQARAVIKRRLPGLRAAGVKLAAAERKKFYALCDEIEGR